MDFDAGHGRAGIGTFGRVEVKPGVYRRKVGDQFGFFWPARRKDRPFTKSTGASGFILVFTSRAFAEFSVQIGVEQVNQLAMELQLASKLVASLPLSVQLLFHFEFMFQFLK